MGKGRKIGVTLLCCAAAAALLSGLGMLLLPHEARGAAHGAIEECTVVDCRASVPEQVSATGDVLLLSPETAAQLGGEACDWLYGDRMVFFAGMTGAEVETCTSAPRTIRAAESGAVAGTGLLLGSEGYCYLTLYGTETEDLERLARRAWAFAADCAGVSVCREAENDGICPPARPDALAVTPVHGKNGAPRGTLGWMLYSTTSLGVQSVNHMPRDTYAVVCVSAFQPEDGSCRRLTTALQVPEQQEILGESILPDGRAGTESTGNITGFSWTYTAPGAYRGKSMLSQEHQPRWELRPDWPRRGQSWAMAQGIHVSHQTAETDRGEITVTVSTPLSLFGGEVTFSETYDFAIA